MKPGIFFERDGILNVVRVERQRQVSPLTLEEFHVNEAIAPLLGRLKAEGFVLIATTNQPGLSRGYQSRRELDRMHDLLRRELPLDDILVCPHDETDSCPCRKPKTGLLVEAAFKWHLGLESLLCRQRQMAGRRSGADGRLHVSCCCNRRGSAMCIAISCSPDLEAIADKILQLRTVVRAVAA